MKRRLVKLLVGLSLLLAVVLAVPSLGQVRRQLGAIDLWWVAVAVGLEVASCLSFVVVFRAFFHRVPASLSRRIAWVEMGSGALLPGGGVTSYVLGGLLLSEAGMERRDIVVRSGGVFWITSAVNAAAVALGAVLLETGIGSGPRDFGRVLVPVLIVAPVAIAIALSPVIARRRTAAASPRWLTALVDGVADAWRAARHPTWRLAGALGYLGFDMAVLACAFRGLGYHATGGALMLAYLVGYCATIIPVPAGIGVLEGGLAGALVLYGAPPATTAAAVLVYHAIAFWVP
ncbi:MAG: lysylphosphatidylglycerol synthase transmembrane domain-containing protein, partial [Solirubrobacteraceae bacterium]